ncbi:hypothetical protein [Brevundimonas sp. G8]|uniref:hypothetical protein n=1 Tax=Brevundimonas sp. G8 TaxID=1350776 RepID=UPI0012F0973B|nr:hypothetical protein [Brevundimonas sp. G8]VXB94086.1 conserved exported hypothetical protein [Brevundimonas sp. G8]
MSKLLKITAVVAAPVMALSLMAAPASAQSRDRDDTGRNALIGAAVGGLAGAIYGNGDGRYIAGGALGGAAIGAVASSSNRGSGCEYYRGGQCYRNQGHWERDHGINSRDSRYEQRRDYRDYRREQRYDRRDDRRDYRHDRRW